MDKFVGSLYILKQKLRFCKVCARWVPHLLSNEQKLNRVNCAKKKNKTKTNKQTNQKKKKYEHCDPNRLDEIVTGDETWINFF